MSWELTWKLGWGSLRADRVREAAERLAATMPGAVTRVEVEDRDCISCYFEVPAAIVDAARESGEQAGDEGPEASSGGPARYTIELSFYDLDSDGCVFSLESEWSDNEAAWDAACQLAEDLADAVGAEPLDL